MVSLLLLQFIITTSIIIMLDFKSLGDLLDLKKWFCTYKMVRSGLCIFI